MTLAETQKQIRLRSAVYTLAILLFIFLFAWWWVILKDTVPPKDEKVYEVVGRIDFGDFRSGSSKKNTFRPTGTAKPAPHPPQQTQQELVTTSAESPASTPPNNETAPQTTEIQDPQETVDPEALFEFGEANDGESNQQGNEGSSFSPTLDPRGLYQFGEGAHGLQGRVPVLLKAPEYTVAKETRITFEFVIAPNGDVVSVKPVTFSTAPELVNAGKKAIYQWKFNPINSDKMQTTRVTITFKLK